MLKDTFIFYLQELTTTPNTDVTLDESKDNKLLKLVDDKKETERFAVSSIDFSRVEIPIVISIWILSASIAKIGNYIFDLIHLVFILPITMIGQTNYYSI